MEVSGSSDTERATTMNETPTVDPQLHSYGVYLEHADGTTSLRYYPTGEARMLAMDDLPDGTNIVHWLRVRPGGSVKIVG